MLPIHSVIMSLSLLFSVKAAEKYRYDRDIFN